MKHIFLALLLLTGSYTFSQQITFNKDSASYEMTDTTVLEDKFDLHGIAQAWVLDNFSNTTEEVRLDDMDTGELTGKGFLNLSKKDKRQCIFSFKISSRDKRYKSQVFDIALTDTVSKSSTTYQAMLGNSNDKKLTSEIDTGVRRLLKDLHTRMKAPMK